MAIDVDPRPTTTAEPRSRRAMLAGALTGLAGLIAGRVAAPDATEAASGDPLILGSLTNNSGTTGTKLSTNGTDTGLYVQQNGTGTALRGLANNGIAGFFTSSNGTGVSGVTAKNNQFGVYGANDAVTNGGGEAIRANGQQNHGLVATTATSSAYAVKAINSGTEGIAILGLASATTGSDGTGVRGNTDAQFGNGVYGYASSPTGTPNGVRGAAGAPAANGVLAQQTAASPGGGAAVRAEGNQNHGVVATAATSSAYAVYATNSAVDGSAINGEATGATGAGFGVKGMSVSGDGVHGDGAVNGVSGLCTNNLGTGVYGESPAGHGVAGVATGLLAAGVYGEGNITTGYGVYCNGNAQVTGALIVTGAITAGTKDFKIDHPLDPANKFMSHSCVESDDRRTVYDGEVTLDARGEATVVLPAWFGALNGQTRIQLTPIGAGAPDLHVKTEVANNHFGIGGGAGGQKIYWHLSAVRQDAYAKAHPLTVEAAKTGTEKGRYLHPEAYGKAASKSIDASHQRPLAAPGH